MAREESVWKHDIHDSSRVCKKLGVSEGVYVHATNLGKTDRNAAYSPACELWYVILFSLRSYLGLQWKDFICLFKSFLGSFPILAWTLDIWLLNSFSRVLLTNARVLLWGFTGTFGNSFAEKSVDWYCQKAVCLRWYLCSTGFQQGSTQGLLSGQMTLCGPDFCIKPSGPPGLRAIEMKTMHSSDLFCRNFPLVYRTSVP